MMFFFLSEENKEQRHWHALPLAAATKTGTIILSDIDTGTHNSTRANTYTR